MVSVYWEEWRSGSSQQMTWTRLGGRLTGDALRCGAAVFRGAVKPPSTPFQFQALCWLRRTLCAKRNYVKMSGSTWSVQKSCPVRVWDCRACVPENRN